MFGAMLLPQFIGCKSQDPWETTYPASGSVVFKGKPVDSAEVTLFPVDSKIPETVLPRGKSGPDGKFVLWTFKAGDGAPAGKYKVTVIHNEVSVSKDTIVAKPNDLPVKVSRKDTTDLEVTIAAGQNELPPFDFK